MRIFIAVAIAALMIAGMVNAQQPPTMNNAQVSENMMQSKVKLLDVTSPAFGDNDRIPVQYTADGDDMSPPLRWEGAPEGVAEYAVICEDPDAPGGTFTHWVIYNIPAGYDHLDEGIMQVSELDNGAMQGKNHFGKIGYGGPSPPKGKPHHYIFTIYGLDAKLDLPTGISKEELRKAMDGHIIAQGKLTGLYGR